MKLLLASQSSSRRAMLTSAAIPHVAISSPLDEDVAKAELRALGKAGKELALGLAEAKATAAAVALGEGDHLILGCDQVLVTQDGTMLDKAVSLEELAEQLRFLSGQSHRLISAAVIIERYGMVWSAVESAQMTMRPLSESFIAEYLASEGEGLLGCVGGYRIEGLGAQLFSAVDGNNFVVQGLPLFPLLDFLRKRAILPS